MYAPKLRDLRAKCKTFLLMSRRKVYSLEKISNFFSSWSRRTTMIVLFLLVAIKVVGHKKCNKIRNNGTVTNIYPHRTFKHLITSLVTPFPFFHRQSLKITILCSHPSHFFHDFLVYFHAHTHLVSFHQHPTLHQCYLLYLFVCLVICFFFLRNPSVINVTMGAWKYCASCAVKTITCYNCYFSAQLPARYHSDSWCRSSLVFELTHLLNYVPTHKTHKFIYHYMH